MKSWNGSRTALIRELNDALRCHDLGGSKMVTAGIEGFGLENIEQVLNAVAKFDDFTPDNDPHGEHDCAYMMFDCVRIIWKIDYYDNRLKGSSPDPSDPTVTKRTMTVMLASEFCEHS